VFAPSSVGVGSIALLHGSEWTRNPSDLAWAAYAMTTTIQALRVSAQ
jgi:hypothetical protein